MKKYLTQYTVAICLLFFGNSFAQSTENQEESLVESRQQFITINQLQSNTASQIVRENTAGTNAVFIQQIGTNNQVYSNITAQSSDIRLQQNGEQNLIDINETSREIEKFVTQNGSNNTITDFSFSPDISTSLEIVQEGNNLTFERFGSNELSKNLKFRMSGNDRTIIVRSF